MLPVLGGIGGLLLLAALWLLGEVTEEATSWFAERLGIGTLRLVTLGRLPRGPVSQDQRLAAAIIGILEIAALVVSVLYFAARF